MHEGRLGPGCSVRAPVAGGPSSSPVHCKINKKNSQPSGYDQYNLDCNTHTHTYPHIYNT